MNTVTRSVVKAILGTVRSNMGNNRNLIQVDKEAEEIECKLLYSKMRFAIINEEIKRRTENYIEYLTIFLFISDFSELVLC
jgi:hypothetical protein